MVARQNRRKSSLKPKLKSHICKPCWELKYCPYGPFAEFSPLSPETFSLKRIKRVHREVIERFANGENRTEHEIASEVERFLWSEPSQWKYIQQFDTSELACNITVTVWGFSG